MKAIRIHQYGGPEVLTDEDVTKPEPGAGEARVKLEAVGVNFIDIYHRTGLYKSSLPITLGMEGAGVVDAVGAGVSSLKRGDRVAYAMVQGAYAEYAVAPAWRLVPIPAELDFRSAAAAMLQGMTAHFLTHSTYPLQPGDSALVHAAAGGTGLLIIQMAKRRGARVFGTVSTEEKAALAKAAGADEIIMYTQSDFQSEVRRLTEDQGVNVVYDSIGQTTFEKSLNALKPRGTLVLFGQSSGPAPPIDSLTLTGKGSLYLTRPSLAHYTANAEEIRWRAGDVFRWIAAGHIKLHIAETFSLSDAAEAHRRLAARRTSGKLLLIL